jgi:hypothetical protein
LSNLKALNIGNDTRYHWDRGNKIGHKGAKYIFESEYYANLTILYANSNELKSLGIQYITNLNNLTILDVAGNGIDPDGAKAISQLENLTSLDVSRNQLRGAGVQHLANMTSLRTLALNGKNQVAGDGVKFLATSNSLTNLRRLHLSKSGIKNEDARLIAESTSLRGLSFIDVTRASGASILRRSMPKSCQVYEAPDKKTAEVVL